MVINALNSGQMHIWQMKTQILQWRNQLDGQINMRDAVTNQFRILILLIIKFL